MDNKNIITGIDIGTTKIAVIIAEKNNNSNINYILNTHYVIANMPYVVLAIFMQIIVY